jgi:hypothetical protein
VGFTVTALFLNDIPRSHLPIFEIADNMVPPFIGYQDGRHPREILKPYAAKL